MACEAPQKQCINEECYHQQVITAPIDGGIADGGMTMGATCGVCPEVYCLRDAMICGYCLPPGESSPPDGGATTCSTAIGQSPTIGPANSCTATVAEDGQWAVCCQYIGGYGGRRTEGLCVTQAVSPASPMVEFLTECAHLEAGSITAFRRLASELARWGAPRSLIARARRAARDEVRHTRLARALLGQLGGSTPQTRVTLLRGRSLEDLALENAVEGCVHETWGAALNVWQSMHAGDAAVRATAQKISDDEASHAELAHDIHRWVMPRLSEAERVRVKSAQVGAIHQLARAPEPGLELRHEVGLPTASVRSQIIQQLQGSIWAA